MRPWTLVIAVSALMAAGLWHLPATAQHVSPPAVAAASPAAPAVSPKPPSLAPERISFDDYRAFRLRDIARRQARLARALAAPDLSPAQKASLEQRKAYYDGLAAMSASERDQLFRARFDQIDSDHDGVLDDAERAAWRVKQRERYRALAAQRAGAPPTQP
jgi:hypothetical protein